MEINGIYHRSSHHARNSGYNRLLDYLSLNNIPSKNHIIPYRAAKFISDHTSQDFGIYDSTSVYKDIELFQQLIFNKKKQRIIHYLHAERDIRFAANYKSYFKNVVFCGTFHKPSATLKSQITNTKYLKKLDGAIAVGANQVQFLKEWLNLEEVAYIPHGIDTEFFKPLWHELTTPKLLFVGQHLRDFDNFNRCVPILAERIKNLEINVIIRTDYYSKIKPHNAIKLLSNLDDVTLKKYYQEATMLFLPLLDATACNSILEAMACGTPIITTNVGGVPEYLKGTKNILAPKGDFDYLIDATVDLIHDSGKLKVMSETSRVKALEYEWNIVADQIMGFYKKLKEQY